MALAPRRTYDLFDSLFSRPLWGRDWDLPLTNPTALTTQVGAGSGSGSGLTLTENEDGYTLTAALPGFSANDVRVSERDGVVRVTAVSMSEEDGFTTSKSVSYSRTVPHDADLETVAATFHDGSLHVTFDRLPEAAEEPVESAVPEPVSVPVTRE